MAKYRADDDWREVSFGFIGGDNKAYMDASVLTWVNRAKKLHEKYPEQTKLVVNKDGSIHLTFPIDWCKFPSPKKVMSEENKRKASERMKKMKNKGEENE